MSHDRILSYARTYVPIAVGALFAWLASLGLELDPEIQAGLVVALTGIIQAAYYALFRQLEKRWPWAGVLLGSRAQPSYEVPAVTPYVGKHRV